MFINGVVVVVEVCLQSSLRPFNSQNTSLKDSGIDSL